MSLLKSAATVSSFTLLSRILGFVRDILMAAALGAGPVAEAFVVAFRFPNLFRRFFGEGAFNSAFVPLFAKRLEGEGPEAARRFAEEALSGLLFVLLLFTGIAELAMPVFVWMIASGFAGDPEKFDLTVLLTRLAFPYLLCMSLVALLGGVLNSLHRFAVAAAAPIALNIVLIAVLGLARAAGWDGTPRTGIALAAGVSIAGIVQIALLWAAAARAGFALRLRMPRPGAAMKRLLMLGIPGVIAGGITQLNLVISTIISSWQPGAPAWLYYADRIYQLPLGLIGVAIGIVLLPDISRRLRAADDEGVFGAQNRALEFALLFTVPAALALMAVPQPVVEVLFERGRFSPEDTTATARALAAFAAGLPAYVMIKVFSPGFFAREDTRTPMLYAGVSVAVNIAGALVLFPYLQHVGIALATAAAAWVNAFLLATTLQRRGAWRTDAQLRRNLPRILLAAFVMGLALLGLERLIGGFFMPEFLFWFRLALLCGLVIAGVVVYFGLAWLLGAITRADLRRALRRPAAE
ncbi:MAG TPA: murein biosynthesis integral membrane protein MurJ [Thermopetrobacter sp.]|nr:murein biosynthesis integral membrane protein MurJ [Thermopetrobacter sp.]